MGLECRPPCGRRVFPIVGVLDEVENEEHFVIQVGLKEKWKLQKFARKLSRNYNHLKEK